MLQSATKIQDAMEERKNDDHAPRGAKEYPHGLRVMAEFFSSGIWAIWLPEENEGLRHGEISHEAIGLQSELAERFWPLDCRLERIYGRP